MNEREELLVKFEKAIPLINELGSLENKSDKYTKTKDRLAKIIVVFAFLAIFSLVVCISFKYGFSGFIEAVLPFMCLLAIAIFGYVTNKKKMGENETEINKIINSDGLSFIPVSYRCQSFDIYGIYKVLFDMRADTLKEAINVWEQDKHNMKMEAKPTVIVK